MNDQLLDDAHGRSSFLESLSGSAVKQLAENGLIMDVSVGTVMTREGHAERELFVILDGVFEVYRGDTHYTYLGKGEIFGEVAFFRDSGKRSASVRATEKGRVVVLRRKFLESLGKSDPRAAQAILFNLGRILSERLVGSL